MTNLESDDLGEATPADVADAATSDDDDDDVVVGAGEDSGATTDPGESLPGDQTDAVMT